MAANITPRITVAVFAIFIVASLARMADRWFERKSSLVTKNAILLLINVLSVGRWLPRAERSRKLRTQPCARKSLRRNHAARPGKR
jgi:hypothetical protein